jgi:hypothetical protein
MNKQTEHGAGSAHLRKAAERTINGLCRQIGLGHAMPPRYVRAITPGANAPTPSGVSRQRSAGGDVPCR